MASTYRGLYQVDPKELPVYIKIPIRTEILSLDDSSKKKSVQK